MREARIVSRWARRSAIPAIVSRERHIRKVERPVWLLRFSETWTGLDLACGGRDGGFGLGGKFPWYREWRMLVL